MLKRNKKPEIRQISDLSAVLLESIKELAKQGKEITGDEMTAMLAARPDVASLIARAKAGDDRPASDATAVIESLREQLGDLSRDQKAASLKYRELQKAIRQERDFNKRMSLALVNLCQVEENERLAEKLEEYKRLLDEEGIARKEQLLAELKNLVPRSDTKTPEEQPKPQKTFLSSLIPSPEELSLDNLKRCYIELLADLKNIIGAESAKELDEISDSILESEDIEFIFSRRTAVVSVIGKYAFQVNSERMEVTRFIKEIGERLAKLEKSFVNASTTVADYQREDEAFNKNIEMELRMVNDAIRDTGDLDKLRNNVISRLDRVTGLLADKRKEYHERIKRVELERDSLMESLDTVIGDLKEQNRQLEEQNRIDTLTEISNRRAFEERLGFELDRYRRYQTPFSVIFFDIDHFKQVNDKYGHTAGDRALKAIAQCAIGALRKSDMIARYGGEEFVVILPETPIDKATQVASKLRLLISETEFEYDNNKVLITISAGVTEVKDSDMDLGQILDRADQHTYRAKEQGRNHVVSDND